MPINPITTKDLTTNSKSVLMLGSVGDLISCYLEQDAGVTIEIGDILKWTGTGYKRATTADLVADFNGVPPMVVYGLYNNLHNGEDSITGSVSVSTAPFSAAKCPINSYLDAGTLFVWDTATSAKVAFDPDVHTEIASLLKIFPEQRVGEELNPKIWVGY